MGSAFEACISGIRWCQSKAGNQWHVQNLSKVHHQHKIQFNKIAWHAIKFMGLYEVGNFIINGECDSGMIVHISMKYIKNNVNIVCIVYQEQHTKIYTQGTKVFKRWTTAT